MNAMICFHFTLSPFIHYLIHASFLGINHLIALIMLLVTYTLNTTSKIHIRLIVISFPYLDAYKALRLPYSIDQAFRLSLIPYSQVCILGAHSRFFPFVLDHLIVSAIFDGPDLLVVVNLLLS